MVIYILPEEEMLKEVGVTNAKQLNLMLPYCKLIPGTSDRYLI